MSIHRGKCNGKDIYWTRKEGSRVLFLFIIILFHSAWFVFLQGVWKEGERGERGGGGGMGERDMHMSSEDFWKWKWKGSMNREETCLS